MDFGITQSVQGGIPIVLIIKASFGVAYDKTRIINDMAFEL